MQLTLTTWQSPVPSYHPADLQKRKSQVVSFSKQYSDEGGGTQHEQARSQAMTDAVNNIQLELCTDINHSMQMST